MSTHAAALLPLVFVTLVACTAAEPARGDKQMSDQMQLGPRVHHGDAGVDRSDGGSVPTVVGQSSPTDLPACPSTLPDAGMDGCFSCILRNCCGSRAGSCVFYGGLWSGNSGCYARGFGAIRDCYAREIASGSSATGWEIAAMCTNEYLPPSDEWVSVVDGSVQTSYDGGQVQVGSFPYDDNPLQELVECVIGSTPQLEDIDGGNDIDAGSEGVVVPWEPNGGWTTERCADECFPDWR